MRDQPMLAVLSPREGMLYLNGRFAGETGPERPFIAPVGPSGEVFLQIFPFDPAYAPATGRLLLSRGVARAESVTDALRVIRWPGSVTEAEILTSASKLSGITRPVADAPGLFVRTGDDAALLGPEGPIAALPAGSALPEIIPGAGGICLLGRWDGGAYLAAVTRDGALMGFLTADVISREGPEDFSATVKRQDSVGHANLERWRLTEDGLQLTDRQPAWAEGAPQWPDSAPGAALAALEAAGAGLWAEARGYCAPQLAASGVLEALAAEGDLPVAIKYPVPGSAPAVGLMKAISPRCAAVTRVLYEARELPGPQGKWRLEALKRE